MKLNIFRNPFVDSQVGLLLESYDDRLRRQTESYWRNKIASEIRQAIDNGSEVNAEGAYLIAKGKVFEEGKQASLNEDIGYQSLNEDKERERRKR